MAAPVPKQGRRGRPGARTLAFLCFLFSLGPNPGLGQSCLGSASEPNSAELAIRFGRQGQGYRVGGRAAANIAGVIGVEAGAAGGKIDRFATTGSETGALLWVSPVQTPFPTCLYSEFENSEETFRDAFEQDRGTFRERWIRFGIGMAVPLGEMGKTGIGLHLAPEVIGRKANLKGRALQVDTTIFVLETKRQNVSTHLGGRCMLSVRRGSSAVMIFFRTRPRPGSDLEWGTQVSFPI